MKLIILIINVIFIYALVALGQTSNTRTIEGTNTPGVFTTKNYVKNPDCAKNLVGITASGGSLTRSTTTPLNEDSGSECAIDASASGQTYTWALNTFGQGMKGQNCEARFIYEGDASLYKTYINNGASKITTDLQLESSTSVAKTVSINFPCGDLSASNTLVIESTSASAAAISVAKVYGGAATNLSNVAQASFYGSLSYPATTNCAWTITQTTYAADFSADTDCGTAVVSGGITAPGTKVPSVVLTNSPPGEYLIAVTFSVGSSASVAPTFAIYDDLGTQLSNQGSYNVSTGNTSFTLTARASYTTAANRTFTIRGKTTSGSTTIYVDGGTGGDLQILVYRYPSSSELALNIRNPVAPTIQKFTSGSGTYTKPIGVKYIRIKAVGGGGGGVGGGTTANNGTSGSDTTFGSSLITAGGGANGAGNGGGTGGSATATGLTAVLAIGGGGSGASQTSATEGFKEGGVGGSSYFGGGGKTSAGGTGGDGSANTGGGGGGGGLATTVSGVSGGGGGSGGYVEAIISNPSATYSYAVGAGGSGGTAGTSGSAGGAGGSGVIIVEEFYDSGNAPLLIGSVTSNSSGLERVERLNGPTGSSCGADPCTISSESGDWISSVTWGATGQYVVNIRAGIFSAAPSCSCTASRPGVGHAICYLNDAPPTSSAFAFACIDAAGANVNCTFSIICQGPRP